MTDNISQGRRIRRRVTIVSVLLLLVAAGIGTTRLSALDFDLSILVPQTVFDVEVVQSVEAQGESVRLQTFLPLSDGRQRIVDERNQSGDLPFSAKTVDGNRVGTWHAGDVSGRQTVVYAFRAVASAVRFEIAPEFRVGEPARGVDRAWLEPTEVIQSADPEVIELAASLVPEDGSLLGFLRAAFDRVQALGFKPFKGTTDALTALRLGEASCNGRSRLLAALLRAQGVPARLVGGVVLTSGTKRTSHQWVEAWVGGHWVPFDPTNRHFAEIPFDYLALYRGDEVLFKHTSDVGFRYHFSIKRELVPRQELEQKRQVLGFWAVFSELGIPLDLLKIVIMIPLGAVVIVLFRNVLGLRTFGTFLPVLIAAAARSTGFLWGALGFVILILAVSLLRHVLKRLELLHSPQLAVLLTMVIGSMLLLAVLAHRAGLSDLARVSLFPVAILAITAERFSMMEDEEGRREAWWTMLRTLVVVGFCYLTMQSLSLQILMLGFPELLLVIIAVDIWLGRWIGLRFTEWLRFRPLLLWSRPAPAGGAPASDASQGGGKDGGA